MAASGLVSLDHAAEMFGVQRKTVTQWHRRHPGAGICVGEGRKLQVDLDALGHWFAEERDHHMALVREGRS